MVKTISARVFWALVATALIARADIIPSFDWIVPNGGNFQINYTAVVTGDQRVEAGDFFTIYDFSGLVLNSAMMPPDWSFTSLLVGVTPSQTDPPDDPMIRNLTWTYTGATPIIGPAALGMFSAVSTFGQLHPGYFAAEGTLIFNGSKVDNVGVIPVPVPEISTSSQILEVCGLGIVGFAASSLRKRNRFRKV
ncbi:MAG: hypothetical protein DMF17_07120 [Verrucomicrobia bacterium]|nr:MAG: hypothetical protein DMF17_07120 [Verrucomicrobiota bacterium]